MVRSSCDRLLRSATSSGWQTPFLDTRPLLRARTRRASSTLRPPCGVGTPYCLLFEYPPSLTSRLTSTTRSPSDLPRILSRILRLCLLLLLRLCGRLCRDWWSCRLYYGGMAVISIRSGRGSRRGGTRWSCGRRTFRGIGARQARSNSPPTDDLKATATTAAPRRFLPVTHRMAYRRQNNCQIKLRC
jgi:hypothetical protein